MKVYLCCEGGVEVDVDVGVVGEDGVVDVVVGVGEDGDVGERRGEVVPAVPAVPVEMMSLGSMISERRVRRRGGAGRVIIMVGEVGREGVVGEVDVDVDALRGVVVVVVVQVDALLDSVIGEVGVLEVDAVVVLVVLVVVVILRGESGGLRLEAGLECF